MVEYSISYVVGNVAIIIIIIMQLLTIITSNLHQISQDTALKKGKILTIQKISLTEI